MLNLTKIPPVVPSLRTLGGIFAQDFYRRGVQVASSDAPSDAGATISPGVVDHGKVIRATNAGAVTFNLPDSAATGMFSGYIIGLINDAGGDATVNRGGSDTFDGGSGTSMVVQNALGRKFQIFKLVGAKWFTLRPRIFRSALQAIPTTSSSTTIAHTLAAQPRRVNIVLKCNTADLGYSSGDEVERTENDGGGTGFQLGFTTLRDATNVEIYYNGTVSLFINRKSATVGAGTAITKANLDYVIEAEY